MKQLSKNKTSKTQASIDIILQDEEMKELLRKLVKKSDEKGADISLSHLQKALQVVWKEVSVKATTEQVSYTLSPDQENFAKKVDAFLEHFGEDLVQHHNRCASSYPFKEDDKEDSSRKARFFISIKTILISMYIVFENEDTVNQQLITKYARRYFKHTFYSSLSNDVHIIKTFFKNTLYAENPNSDTIPEYRPNCYSYASRWYNREDFTEFCSNYKYSRDTTSETALYVIWFINKFF